jgi:2-isopropylmalate synthase
MSGFYVSPNKAVVGSNAFSHGSGMHQDALLKAAETYQIIDPALIGNLGQRIVIGPHSGRHGLKHKLLTLGRSLDGEALDRAFDMVKELAKGRKTLSDDELLAIALECQRPHSNSAGGFS